MQRRKYLIILPLLLALSACSTAPKVVTVTKAEVIRTEIVPRPAPIRFAPIDITITEATNDFTDSLATMPIKDYENLALNFADITRWIEETIAIIEYYEAANQKEEEENNE